MPIHRYHCGKCKKEYEVLYTMFSAVEREEPLEKCPECKSKRKTRAIAAPSFILKGKWAKDGY